jgi:hypothetical protein
MALQPLYDVAAGYDADVAAKLLGNLFCRIGVQSYGSVSSKA